MGLIAAGGSAAAVADATLDAAAEGLEQAVTDSGMRDVVMTLAQVVLAARGNGFAIELCGLGLPITREPTTFELVGALADALDDRFSKAGERSDFTEMAQMAAVEALTALVGSRTAGLFEGDHSDVREAVRELSTPRGFGSIAHEFFGALMRRFLHYHLSRELSCHVGVGVRFADVHAHQRFLEQLDFTCREASLVVRDYAGEWYSKANFETGITRQQVTKFTSTSLRKLRMELQRRGARHAVA